MSDDGRLVYLNDENVIGEIVSEQLHGAYIRYHMGGFDRTEFFTTDDYDVLDYFDYEEEE